MSQLVRLGKDNNLPTYFYRPFYQSITINSSNQHFAIFLHRYARVWIATHFAFQSFFYISFFCSNFFDFLSNRSELKRKCLWNWPQQVRNNNLQTTAKGPFTQLITVNWANQKRILFLSYIHSNLMIYIMD